MMTRALPLLLAGLLLTAAGFLFVATGLAWTPTGGDCNNLAGECLRQRQQLARFGVGIVYAGSAMWAAWAAVVTIRRCAVDVAPLAAAVVAAWLLLIFFAADPAERFNDRWDGWLASAQDERSAAARACASGCARTARSSAAARWRQTTTPQAHAPRQRRDEQEAREAATRLRAGATATASARGSREALSIEGRLRGRESSG